MHPSVFQLVLLMWLVTSLDSSSGVVAQPHDNQRSSPSTIHTTPQHVQAHRVQRDAKHKSALSAMTAQSPLIAKRCATSPPIQGNLSERSGYSWWRCKNNRKPEMDRYLYYTVEHKDPEECQVHLNVPEGKVMKLQVCGCFNADITIQQFDNGRRFYPDLLNHKCRRTGISEQHEDVYTLTNEVVFRLKRQSQYKVSLKFNLTIVNASDAPRLNVIYLSPSVGYIQSPENMFKKPVIDCATLQQPNGHVIFLTNPRQRTPGILHVEAGESQIFLMEGKTQHPILTIQESYAAAKRDCAEQGAVPVTFDYPQEWIDVVAALTSHRNYRRSHHLVDLRLVSLSLEKSTDLYKKNMYMDTWQWGNGAVAYYIDPSWTTYTCAYTIIVLWSNSFPMTARMPCGELKYSHNSDIDKYRLCKKIPNPSKHTDRIVLKTTINVTAAASRVSLVTCPLQHVTHAMFACDRQSLCSAGRVEARGMSSTVTCRMTLHPTRTVPYFACTTSSEEHVPFSAVCDWRQDCGDNSDESFCEGYCLPVYTRCNDMIDCPGHEDEADCGVYTCEGLYRCRGLDRTICLHGNHLCDGRAQCPQLDDELRCGMTESCPDHCVCYGTHLYRPEAVLHLRYLEGREFRHSFMKPMNDLKHVSGDNFKVCCSAVLPKAFTGKCLAPVDEISSCENLLKSGFYALILAAFALLALSGNLGCFVYRLTMFSAGRSKTGFLMFVIHLSMSDFLMGIYLSILGVTDRLYAGSYLWNEMTWKGSTACRIAGFLSLLSCEVSSFLICLITLDRFLVIRFPFSRLRFGTTSAQVACGVVWGLGVILASIPLLPGTSHWAFYSQTGICIPLPVTRTDFPGRHYSFAIMIVLNLVMFLLIAVGQAFIYWSVKANTLSSKDVSKNKDDVIVKDKTRSKEFTIARRLLVIAVSDFLCWFPIGVCGLLAKLDIPVPGEVNAAMATIVLPVNAALNPFLYTYTILRQRRQKEKEAILQRFVIAQVKNELAGSRR
ncbi:hypothetical protein ACOMHN_053979 [Nucella lapillus]